MDILLDTGQSLHMKIGIFRQLKPAGNLNLTTRLQLWNFPISQSIWDRSNRRSIRLVYDVIISSQFRVKLFAWFHFLISRTLVSASLIEICILKSLSCILRIFF